MKTVKKGKIFLIIFLLILLSACGSEEGDHCKVVVEKFLTAYQSLDQNAGQYLADRYNDIQFNGVQEFLAQKMTFSIEGVKKEDDQFIVKTTISTLDFKDAFESVIEAENEETSVEAVLEDLYDTLEDESAKVKEFPVKIPVKKCGEEYKLILTAELSNALFGGYNEYLSELTGGILNEQTVD